MARAFRERKNARFASPSESGISMRIVPVVYVRAVARRDGSGPIRRGITCAANQRLSGAGNAKDQSRSLGGRFEIRPFGKESTPRDLRTARRAHLDLELALRVVVKAVDDRGPISDFSHA